MQNWMSSWWKMKKEMNWKLILQKKCIKKQRVEKNWEEKRKDEEKIIKEEEAKKLIH